MNDEERLDAIIRNARDDIQNVTPEDRFALDALSAVIRTMELTADEMRGYAEELLAATDMRRKALIMNVALRRLVTVVILNADPDALSRAREWFDERYLKSLTQSA